MGSRVGARAISLLGEAWIAPSEPEDDVRSTPAVAPVIIIARAVWPVVHVKLWIGPVAAVAVCVLVVPVPGVADDQDPVLEGEGIVTVVRRKGSRTDDDRVNVCRA